MDDENVKFYLYGKFFDSEEEMFDYAQKWPDEPCNLEFFRKFLDDRYTEAEFNVNLHPEITNRFIFMLLREYTEFTQKGKIK